MSEPNGVVGPIHPKGMRVILITQEDYDVWLNAPTGETLKLQRPLPHQELMFVAEAQRSDQRAESAAQSCLRPMKLAETCVVGSQ
jgi:putative SOS response-associated peptidase YedK